MMKRAVRPPRRMTLATMSRSCGAKSWPPASPARAAASSCISPEGTPPPRKLRITLAVDSRMSRMLKRRRRLRRAHWLQASTRMEKPMAAYMYPLGM